ncbi:hypothetical protein GQ457_15G010210 [Hibiscus cannabinus]
MQNLLIDRESLWIAWVREYVMRGADFWQLECKPHFSWCMKRLLKLRVVAHPILSTGVVLTVRTIWEDIRETAVPVEWHKLIWFALHIPKHAVIAWMTILNRLPSKDRLIRMGIEVDSVCVNCGVETETRSHLFFTCSYSKEVWKRILQLCGVHRSVSNWEDELGWAVRHLKGRSFIVFVLKLAWQAYVYYVWEERNRRCFRGTFRSVDSLLHCIQDVVRIRAHTKNIRLDDVNKNICVAWGIL